MGAIRPSETFLAAPTDDRPRTEAGLDRGTIKLPTGGNFATRTRKIASGRAVELILSSSLRTFITEVSTAPCKLAVLVS